MRRTLITMLAVLALALGACAAGTACVGNTIRQAEAHAQQATRAMRASDAVEAGRAARELLALWLARRPVLELLTSHDALSEVQGSVEDALLCLEHNQRLEFLRAIAGAVNALERLRAAESPRLMNLF